MIAGLVVCGVVLTLATGFGLSLRRRDGTLRVTAAAQRPGPAEGRLTEAELGRPLGARATLLQFSSAFCAPCRATRQVLGEVASLADGVAHVEIDAAERLDLVRLLDVRRTPTVFVLGPEGQVARRGSGLMRKADVLAALGDTA